MFHSTRGNHLVTSSEAILDGLAKDGGLYVLDQIPSLDYKTMMEDDYITMASKILALFFDEFSYEEIYQEVKEGYRCFNTKNVVELKKSKDVFFLELFHGPTLAFKDLALVILPRLLKLSKKKLGIEKNITILTATSGDTGGAALNGFRNIDGVSIVVLYPNGGISNIQEAQMCSFRSKNAEVLAVDGNFDDCQNLVKEFFKNHKDLSITSANSINIGRLIPQIVYYYYSYIELLRTNNIKADEKINFVVPTGNFGNIFAGFCAKKMGLPIHHLICASNKNSVLTDYFNSGIYNKNRPFYKTNSPSMDILISSNLERFIYYASNQNTNLTIEKMEQLQTNGKYELKNPYEDIEAYSINEKETEETIVKLFKETGYLIDPHTAVAYGAYLKQPNKDYKTVIVSTASPFKFPKAIMSAFGKEEDSNPLEWIQEKSKLSIPKVLNYPKVERKVVSLEASEQTILDVIKCFM